MNGIQLRANHVELDPFDLHLNLFSGQVSFATSLYAQIKVLHDFIDVLKSFAAHIRSGICDFQFGKFGREFAGGAVHIRFLIVKPGEILIRVQAETEYTLFGGQEESESARLLMVTQASLLDSFIGELEALVAGRRTEATLGILEQGTGS